MSIWELRQWICWPFWYQSQGTRQLFSGDPNRTGLASLLTLEAAISASPEFLAALWPGRAKCLSILGPERPLEATRFSAHPLFNQRPEQFFLPLTGSP